MAMVFEKKINTTTAKCYSWVYDQLNIHCQVAVIFFILRKNYKRWKQINRKKIQKFLFIFSSAAVQTRFFIEYGFSQRIKNSEFTFLL